MKLHLDHNPAPSVAKIDHHSQVMLVGSCFADNVGKYLEDHKFKVNVNPGGIYFNPLSIFKFLTDSIRQIPVEDNRFVTKEGVCCSYDHHSSIHAKNPQDLRFRISQLYCATADLLRSTEYLVITFGSAYAYHLQPNDQMVSNCHKQPASNFLKKLIGVSEITSAFSQLYHLLKKSNPTLKFILTVSPVKYLRDGLELNSLSKSTLILATHQIIQSHSDCFYFYYCALLQHR